MSKISERWNNITQFFHNLKIYDRSYLLFLIKTKYPQSPYKISLPSLDICSWHQVMWLHDLLRQLQINWQSIPYNIYRRILQRSRYSKFKITNFAFYTKKRTKTLTYYVGVFIHSPLTLRKTNWFLFFFSKIYYLYYKLLDFFLLWTFFYLLKHNFKTFLAIKS